MFPQRHRAQQGRDTAVQMVGTRLEGNLDRTQYTFLQHRTRQLLCGRPWWQTQRHPQDTRSWIHHTLQERHSLQQTDGRSCQQPPWRPQGRSRCSQYRFQECHRGQQMRDRSSLKAQMHLLGNLW